MAFEAGGAKRVAESHRGWAADELAQLERRGLRRPFGMRESPHVAGQLQVSGRSFIDLSSNDYLGLSADGRLVDAVRRAAGHAGWGAASSPLVTGRSVLHARLERELAAFKGTPRALLFPTGYAANVGTISALSGRGDTIYSDAKNHASIIDGCRLSRAEISVYRHCDLVHLRELLRRPVAGRRLIVTDSVFSMDGDVAPLGELAELAAEFDCLLIIDDAHATGVLGKTGRGGCESADLDPLECVCVGTLSKALGSLGGFVAGADELVELVWHRARSLMFSTAQPEAISAAGCVALEISQSETWRCERVKELTRRLATGLRAQGWQVGPAEAAILPVYLGRPQDAVRLATALQERGVWAPAIRPPAVPVGESLLRLSLTAGHTDEQLDQVLRAFADEDPVQPPTESE